MLKALPLAQKARCQHSDSSLALSRTSPFSLSTLYRLLYSQQPNTIKSEDKKSQIEQGRCVKHLYDLDLIK